MQACAPDRSWGSAGLRGSACPDGADFEPDIHQVEPINQGTGLAGRAAAVCGINSLPDWLVGLDAARFLS